MAFVLGVLEMRGMVSSDAVTPYKNGVAKITLSQGGRNQLIVLIVHSRLYYLTRHRTKYHDILRFRALFINIPKELIISNWASTVH